MRALRRLVESRRDLVQDRVRLTNRLTFTLKAYFPQVLDLFRDKETEVFVVFLERWPSLPDAQRARRETIVDVFHAHSVRRGDVIDRRIDASATRSRAITLVSNRSTTASGTSSTTTRSSAASASAPARSAGLRSARTSVKDVPGHL